MLTRMRKSEYTVIPAGLNSNVFDDYWVHLAFKFNPETCDIEVSNWWLTDIFNKQISLNSLSYNDVQFVAQVMAEEFVFHSSVFYHDIEMKHYAAVSND